MGKVMMGIPVRPEAIHPIDIEFVCCEVPQFSFGRLKNSDPRLGVEMQSTGEVACFGKNHYEAFLKSMIAAGFKLPTKNILVSVGSRGQKAEFLEYAVLLKRMGFQLYATKGTFESWQAEPSLSGSIMVYKPKVKREPNVATMLRDRKLDLVINVADSMDSQAATDGFEMRRIAVDSAVPLISDIKTAILV